MRRLRLVAASLLAAMLLTTTLAGNSQAVGWTAEMLTAFAYNAQTAKVTVYYDGMISTLSYADCTVGTLLKTQGVTLEEHDIVSPAQSAHLEQDMTITVTRAVSSVETFELEVPYTIVYVANEYLPRGTEKVVSEGSNGTRTITYDVIKSGSTEISRTVIDSSVTAEAKDRVIEYGPGGTITTGDGKTLRWSHKIKARATAYTTEGYDDKTNALGRVARTGTVAVDPRVIPLKSTIYVEGTNGKWVYGEAVAEDTGGAVKGNIIDLYFDTRAECFSFGRKTCTVYILENT